MKMKLLLENWRKHLLEVRQHYRMIVSLRADAGTTMYGSVFNKIRAIPGITIVKTAGASKKDRYGNKISTLELKFLMEPGLGAEYSSYIRNQLKILKDEEGDKILGVRIVKFPEKTKE